MEGAEEPVLLTDARLAHIARVFAANSLASLYVKEFPNRRGPGRYIFVNPAFSDLIGRSIHEVIGKTDFDLFPEPIAKMISDNDLTVLGTGVSHYFEESTKGSEGEMHFLAHKVPLFDEANRLFAVAGQSYDLTELRALQRKAARGDRLRATIRALNGDTYLVVSPDGLLVDVDDAGQFGIEDDALGKPLDSVLPTDLCRELEAAATTLTDVDRIVDIETGNHTARMRLLADGQLAIALRTR